MYQWCEFKSRRGKNKNLSAQRYNSNTVWFNFQFQTYTMHIYIRHKIPLKKAGLYGRELRINFQRFCLYIYIYIYKGVDVVEWSRALDVRLSEWCCSVSMVWVQIPSREEQKFDSSKNLISNTVWFNFQTYIYMAYDFGQWEITHNRHGEK